MKVLVEIHGLLSVGKSTLLERLTREHSILPELLKPIVPSKISVFKKLIQLVACLALSKPFALLRLGSRRDGRWLLAKLAYRWAGLLQRPVGGLLWDSGLLQPLLSHAAEYSDRFVRIEDALAVLHILPLPQAVIYLDSGVETAYQRYCQRQELTGRRAGVKVTQAGFVQAQEICDHIVGMFPLQQVLRVNGVSDIGNGTLDEIAQRLFSWMNDTESRVK